MHTKLFKIHFAIFLAYLFISNPTKIYANNDNITNADKPIQGQWIDASSLKPGMKILTANNQIITVDQPWIQRKEKTTTYNFTVNNSHTYYVGKHSFWVHNMCDEYLKHNIFNPSHFRSLDYVDDLTEHSLYGASTSSGQIAKPSIGKIEHWGGEETTTILIQPGRKALKNLRDIDKALKHLTNKYKNTLQGDEAKNVAVLLRAPNLSKPIFHIKYIELGIKHRVTFIFHKNSYYYVVRARQ